MILKDLPQDARPREKLLARGPGALSDAELLAVLLRTGMPGKNVLQMGQELLRTFGGLSGLLHTTADDLQRVNGLGGTAKRAQLVAVLELARRALAEKLKDKTMFDTPQAVRDYLQLQLGSRPHEVFAVLFLDSQHRLIALEELFRGTPPAWYSPTTTPAARPNPHAPTRCSRRPSRRHSHWSTCACWTILWLPATWRCRWRSWGCYEAGSTPLSLYF
jgi:hypothetical protein